MIKFQKHGYDDQIETLKNKNIKRIKKVPPMIMWSAGSVNIEYWVKK